MSILNRSAAVQIKKMSVISDIIISEEEVKMKLNYSSIDLKLEDIPKLLSDVMQLYVYVKPILDKQQAKALKDKAKDLEKDAETIDLSEIPF